MTPFRIPALGANMGVKEQAFLICYSAGMGMLTYWVLGLIYQLLGSPLEQVHNIWLPDVGFLSATGAYFATSRFRRSLQAAP